MKTTIHHYVIPVTEYAITLFDDCGRKAEFGNNIAEQKEFSRLLWQKLRPVLRERMLTKFDSGQTIELGRLKLSYAGIEIKPYLGKPVFVSAEALSSCKMEGTFLRIWENYNERQRVHALMISSVHNLFPLLDVIELRLRPRAMQLSMQ